MSEFPPEEEKKSHSFLIPLLLTFFGVLLGSGFLYLKATYPSLFIDSLSSIKATLTTKSKIVSDITPSPSTFSKPGADHVPVVLPQGSQSYTFSHGDQVKGPRPSAITLDPLAPQSGQSQTLTLKATHPYPITSVSIEIITDNQTKPYTLSLVDGTTQDGTWSSSWNIEDSYNYKYGLRLILTSADHNYDNTMWFR